MLASDAPSQLSIKWDDEFREHGQRLFGFIMGYVRNPSTAEEVLQDVFVRALRAQSTFKGQSSPSTWLFSIARNLCIDTIRRNKHRNHTSLESETTSSATPLVESIGSESPSPEETVRFRLFTQELNSALAELPAEQSEVFRLREFQHKSFDEIAQITDTQVNTTKSRMRYALKALRTRLSAHDPGETS